MTFAGPKNVAYDGSLTSASRYVRSCVPTDGPPPCVEFVHDAEVLWHVPVDVPRPDVAEAHAGVFGAERSGFYATL